MGGKKSPLPSVEYDLFWGGAIFTKFVIAYLHYVKAFCARCRDSLFQVWGMYRKIYMRHWVKHDCLWAVSHGTRWSFYSTVTSVIDVARKPYRRVKTDVHWNPHFPNAKKGWCRPINDLFITVRSSLVLLTTHLIAESRPCLQDATSLRLAVTRHILAALCWMSS
jgi:hypothetical protein